MYCDVVLLDTLLEETRFDVAYSRPWNGTLAKQVLRMGTESLAGDFVGILRPETMTT